MAIQEGGQLGHYRLEAKLGAGGMGTVWRARDERLQRPVAIKLLSLQLTTDAEYVARFRREAKLAAQFNHPNLVQVFDTGEGEDTCYMVMELVEGENLAQRLKRKGALEPREALAVAVYVAEALAFAWGKARLVHRDIKPANIFLSTAGTVKVGDLGLAKCLQEASTGLTQSGTVMGTPQYMSPEQGRAAKQLDFRSDIYSLGCVLFHMLTGRPPYEADTTAALIYKHVHEPPPDVRAVLPDCPPPLVRLLDWMMAKTPAARPENYEALIRKLYSARNSLKPGPRLARAAPDEVAVTLLKRAPLARRTMALVAAGGVTLVALIAGLLWWSVGHTKPQPASAAVATNQPALVPVVAAIPVAATNATPASPPPAPPLAAVDLQRGLAAYYPLAGDAQDYSGNNNHGEAHAVVFISDTQRGSVGWFNGSNAYISAAPQPSLDVTGPFTLAAWINPEAIEQQHYIFFKAFRSAGYSLFIDGGAFRFSIAGKPVVTGQLPTQRWTHVAGIYDGTNLVQFINGKPVNSIPAPVPKNSPTKLFIGCWLKGPTHPPALWFRGCLDDVRIYARALSVSEITALYSLTQTGSLAVERPPATDAVPPVQAPQPATSVPGKAEFRRGLAAYYPLAGDAQDYSGNNNHGTPCSVLFPTDPLRGRVCRFNGADSFIRVPRTPGLEFAGPFTLTAWVCPDETDKVRAIMAKEFNFSGYQLCVNKGAVSFSLAHKGGITGKLPVRQWTHVAGVFDCTNLMQYSNGNLMNTIESNISRHSRTDLHLGCWMKPGQPPSRLFKGDMAEVRLYARALSGEELKALFTATKAGPPAAAPAAK